MIELPPLNILFICTGNICRSPLALQLLEHSLGEVAGGTVPVGSLSLLSRGLTADSGAPMDPQSAKQSVALGGDPSKHVAAALTADDLRAADLVVTMTLEQRAAAARMLPAASKRSVTLMELARLIDHLPPGQRSSRRGSASPKLRVEQLLAKRSAVPPPRHQHELSIADPYRRSAGTHARVARQIQSAIEPLAGWLSVVLAEQAIEPATDAEPPVRAAVPLTRRDARALQDLELNRPHEPAPVNQPQ